MFPRRARVPASELKTANTSVKRRSLFFILKTAPNHSRGTRYAVIVGVNVDRKSVRRHTLKCRASAVLKRYDLGDADVVLIVLKNANTLSAEEFRDNLNKIMQAG